VVTGYNLGCGSSREQAVTSILAKVLPLVVSGRVCNTFNRNAINNALPLLEIPRLVQRLREAFSNTKVQTSQQDGKSRVIRLGILCSSGYFETGEEIDKTNWLDVHLGC
jgi:3-isopropylmalate dehydratase small subunit